MCGPINLIFYNENWGWHVDHKTLWTASFLTISPVHGVGLKSKLSFKVVEPQRLIAILLLWLFFQVTGIVNIAIDIAALIRMTYASENMVPQEFWLYFPPGNS